MSVDLQIERLRPVSYKSCRGLTLLELMLAVALLSLVTTVSFSTYRHFVERAENLEAIQGIRNVEMQIDLFFVTQQRYPDSLTEVNLQNVLDAWGNQYQYFNIATSRGNGQLRKDRNLVPINSDYDLYSNGADGLSVSPLTAKHSRDDIIRANNGQYIGLAEDY